MSLSHEFLLISPDSISQLMSFSSLYKKDVRFDRFDMIQWPEEPHRPVVETELEHLMTYYRKHRCDCVSIADSIILASIPLLENVNTLMHGFIPYRGINYYGFTVIPLESIDIFTKVLNSLPKKDRYLELIDLCRDAKKLNRHILHCGI